MIGRIFPLYFLIAVPMNANSNGFRCKNHLYKKIIGHTKKIYLLEIFSSKFIIFPKFIKIFLRKYINDKKNNGIYKWTKIASEHNKINKGIMRLGKHCRERWFNHLDPSISR